jgi:hypothetical protein
MFPKPDGVRGQAPVAWKKLSKTYMGVKFSSLIPFGYVELGKVAHAGHLDVVRCMYEMGACDGSRRDQTGAITTL